MTNRSSWYFRCGARLLQRAVVVAVVWSVLLFVTPVPQLASGDAFTRWDSWSGGGLGAGVLYGLATTVLVGLPMIGCGLFLAGALPRRAPLAGGVGALLGVVLATGTTLGILRYVLWEGAGFIPITLGVLLIVREVRLCPPPRRQAGRLKPARGEATASRHSWYFIRWWRLSLLSLLVGVVWGALVLGTDLLDLLLDGELRGGLRVDGGQAVDGAVVGFIVGAVAGQAMIWSGLAVGAEPSRHPALKAAWGSFFGVVAVSIVTAGYFIWALFSTFGFIPCAVGILAVAVEVHRFPAPSKGEEPRA